MGYYEALKAANVEVIDYREFGDYQGTWYAVTPSGVIVGSYGSCSVCDAFEAEFDYNNREYTYDIETGLEVLNPNWQANLKAFGERYVGDERTLKQAIEIAEEDAKYDSNATKAVEWLKSFQENK